MIYDNDDEWPSIADASKRPVEPQLKDQPLRVTVMKKQAPNSNRNNVGDGPSTVNTILSSNNDTVLTIATKKSHPNNHATNTSPQLEPNKRQTTSMKSYKERADEYAKARLRILGSAFSEEDKPDGHDSMTSK